MCGGSGLDDLRRGRGLGLSPRVRGKPAGGNADAKILRSIPACAGEAWTAASAAAASAVYPRVCGGSSPDGKLKVQDVGLSPRVRGKPVSGYRGRCPNRSIPACAGEAP